MIIPRRKKIASKKSYAAFQGLTTNEDTGTKLRNIFLLTPGVKIEDDVENSNAKIVKEINCNHVDCKLFLLRSEILSFMISFEKKLFWKNLKTQRCKLFRHVVFFDKTFRNRKRQ